MNDSTIKKYFNGDCDDDWLTDSDSDWLGEMLGRAATSKCLSLLCVMHSWTGFQLNYFHVSESLHQIVMWHDHHHHCRRHHHLTGVEYKCHWNNFIIVCIIVIPISNSSSDHSWITGLFCWVGRLAGYNDNLQCVA